MGFIIGLIFAVLSIGFIVRMCLALFSKRYRNLVGKRLLLHVLWGLFTAMHLFATSGFLFVERRRARSEAVELQHRVEQTSQEPNKTLDATSQ